jgi:hypothetical protein
MRLFIRKLSPTIKPGHVCFRCCVHDARYCDELQVIGRLHVVTTLLGRNNATKPGRMQYEDPIRVSLAEMSRAQTCDLSSEQGV